MARSKRIRRDHHTAGYGPQGGRSSNDNNSNKDAAAHRIRNDSTVDDLAAADVLTGIASTSIHPSIETSDFSPAVPPSRRSTRIHTGLSATSAKLAGTARTAQRDGEVSNKLFVQGLDPDITNDEGEALFADLPDRIATKIHTGYRNDDTRVGLAYITFKNQERAAQAKWQLERAYSAGGDLSVEYCKLRKKEKDQEEDPADSSLSDKEEDEDEEVEELGNHTVLDGR